MTPSPLHCLALTGLLLALAAEAFAEFEPATRKPLSHYLEATSDNPFGPPTQRETPVATPNFAKNLYINGIMDFEGEKTIYIADKNDKSVFSLAEGRPHDGIELVEVEMSPTVGSSTVVVRKDAQTAKLTFDQAQMFGQVPAPSPTPAKPGTSALPSQAANQNASPTVRTARPTTLRKPRPVRIIRKPKNR
ncbi:MAG: hypothetical protein AAGK14_02675 [Verrucomicrobiota bacterium]